MKKVIKLNESELKHLISESVKRILAEDEDFGHGVPEEFDGEDFQGMGDEMSQDDRWRDYDEAEKEHEVNMLNDHPHLYDKPEGYDISDDFGWQSGSDEGDEPMGFESMGDEEGSEDPELERAIAEAVNRALVKESRKNRQAKALEESVDRVYNRLFGKK